MFLKSLIKSRETSLSFLGGAPSQRCPDGHGWRCSHLTESTLGWDRCSEAPHRPASGTRIPGSPDCGLGLCPPLPSGLQLRITYGVTPAECALSSLPSAVWNTAPGFQEELIRSINLTLPLNGVPRRRPEHRGRAPQRGCDHLPTGLVSLGLALPREERTGSQAVGCFWG